MAASLPDPDPLEPDPLDIPVLTAKLKRIFGQLTGGVAHELNNMLTVITGTIEILAEAVAGQPQMAAVAK